MFKRKKKMRWRGIMLSLNGSHGVLNGCLVVCLIVAWYASPSKNLQQRYDTSVDIKRVYLINDNTKMNINTTRLSTRVCVWGLKFNVCLSRDTARRPENWFASYQKYSMGRGVSDPRSLTPWSILPMKRSNVIWRGRKNLTPCHL